ncbi:hypothetical protein ACFZAM_31580 [Streptomyces sp. NPDC008079]|uniref:hypothetical protein n=1 Tax=Streptomyces sp. NPDC008079 TaxID=3364806 RepID=UPI0036E04DD6
MSTSVRPVPAPVEHVRQLALLVGWRIEDRPRSVVLFPPVGRPVSLPTRGTPDERNINAMAEAAGLFRAVEAHEKAEVDKNVSIGLEQYPGAPAAAEPEQAKFACPDDPACTFSSDSAPGLGAHRFRAHGVRSAKHKSARRPTVQSETPAEVSAAFGLLEQEVIRALRGVSDLEAKCERQEAQVRELQDRMSMMVPKASFDTVVQTNAALRAQIRELERFKRGVKKVILTKPFPQIPVAIAALGGSGFVTGK